jgi:transcriptional regulator with XRE-family HTH domain
MLNVQLIKKTMRALGLTGKDVGDACGVTKEAASNWLKGESMPRPSKLIDLAALLKLPVEQLLAPVEARPEPIVAYRMRNNRAPTVEAQEAGDEVA